MAGRPGQAKLRQDGDRDRSPEEAGAQEGFPGELVSGSGLGVTFKAATASEDTFQTRVKLPKAGEAEKAEKEDRLKIDREPVKVSGTVSEKRIAKLQNDLQEQADMLAAVMSIKLPVTAVYTGTNSHKAIEALLNIARKRPKMLDALEKASDGFDAVEIGKFAVGMAVAFQVDLGRLNPDSFPAVITGVTSVFNDAGFVENDGALNPNVMSMPEPAHAVRFEPQV